MTTYSIALVPGHGIGPEVTTQALAVLDAAYASGVTFFDTADVYGDGRSEQTIGRWRRKNPDADVFVATKMIRRAEVPDLAHATLENFSDKWLMFNVYGSFCVALYPRESCTSPRGQYEGPSLVGLAVWAKRA